MSLGEKFAEIKTTIFMPREGHTAGEQFKKNMERREFALLNYIKLFFLSALKLPQLFGTEVEHFFMAGVGSYIFNGVVLGFTAISMFWTLRKLAREKNRNIEFIFDTAVALVSDVMFLGLGVGAVVLPGVMQAVLTYATVAFVVFMMLRSAVSLFIDYKLMKKAQEEGKEEIAAIYKENIWHHSLMVVGCLAVAALFIVFLTVPVASWPIFVTLAVLGVAYPIFCFLKGIHLHRTHQNEIKSASQTDEPTDHKAHADALKNARTNSEKLIIAVTEPKVLVPDTRSWFAKKWDRIMEVGMKFYRHVERKKELFSKADAKGRWDNLYTRIELKLKAVNDKIASLTLEAPKSKEIKRQEARKEFLEKMRGFCKNDEMTPDGIIRLLKLAPKASPKVPEDKEACFGYNSRGVFRARSRNRSELEALRKHAITLLRQEREKDFVRFNLYKEQPTSTAAPAA